MPGDGNLAGVVGAVDFGDDRRQHRRPRRHLDHLDAGIRKPRDAFDPGTGRAGDGMAFPAALVLVEQVTWISPTSGPLRR